MKKIIYGIGATVSLAVLFLATSSAQVKAVTAPLPAPGQAGQALEIAPPVINLTANPGQTLTAQISLRGVSKDKLLVRGEVNDFIAAGEDGTPKLLLEEGEDSPYSLRPWVSKLPQLTLEPRQIKNMPVTIKVPANAAPGGYYGVVRFTATAPELKDTGVALSASLGSLILVRVNGQAKESLKIEEFAANSSSGVKGWLFESLPISFLERIKNDGNVHEQPAGQITITDMFNKKIATVNVNLPPRNILPQSIRKFEQPLDSAVLGNTMLFGKYQADLKLTYGDTGQVVTASLTFWVIPYKLITLIIVGLIGGFFILRFLIRRYNRRIISRARGGGGLNMRRRR
ncbi:MAG TPA: hypothetical protein VLA88_04010 [Candidatus Saccharimonadales bacterium]|nr:hypothetical protein [Candidatus Saccharimonadales bacterium]